jgi:hypothetical protein
MIEIYCRLCLNIFRKTEIYKKKKLVRMLFTSFIMKGMLLRNLC